MTITISNNLKLILITIGLTLASIFVISISRKDVLQEYNKKFTAYQDSVVKPTLLKSNELKHLADSTKKVADSVHQENLIKEVKIGELSKEVVYLEKRNTKLADSLAPVITKLPIVCKPAVIMIDSLNQEKDSLVKLTQEQVTLNSAKDLENQALRAGELASMARADSLQHVIINWPKPPKEKFLWIFPHVSPTTSFIIGAVAGGILSAKLKN